MSSFEDLRQSVLRIWLSEPRQLHLLDVVWAEKFWDTRLFFSLEPDKHYSYQLYIIEKYIAKIATFILKWTQNTIQCSPSWQNIWFLSPVRKKSEI